jgi:hypothetical protein
MPENDEQPQQLTFRYPTPTRPITASLTLSGMFVLAEAPGGSDEDLYQYLRECGVEVESDVRHGVHFNARELSKLRGLPDRVTIVVAPALESLKAVLIDRVDDGLPVTATANPNGSLELMWESNGEEQFATLTNDAAVAFLQSTVSFSATADAWKFLSKHSKLPVEVGVARSSITGAIEISTSKPQLLEQVPPSTLRGMYKVDHAHFGVPLAYVGDIENAPGLRWEGSIPEIDHAASELDSVPIELSSHTRRDLGAMVEQLAAYKAQAVVWDSGLGRRVFALSAITVLDAWPLLIVAPPSSIWAWQRHLDLLGKKGSLRHGRDDVHLVTYRDLAKRHIPLVPASIIFDGLASDEAVSDQAVVAALHRLDGIMHAYRVAIDATWPDDLDESTKLLSLLKPGEFDANVPAVQRYPIFTNERARDHIQIYLSPRSLSDPDSNLERSVHRFRRSSTVCVDVTEPQRLAFDAVRDRGGDAAHVLAECLEIISNGTAQAVSPKVTAAAQRAREASLRKKTIVVVTRHDRTAVLIKSLLRGIASSIVTSPSVYEGCAQVQIVVCDGQVPPLLAFDEVIFVDYPWSFSAIERAVGSAATFDGPQQVTCIHLVGSIDDRIAMLAARRRELDKVQSTIAPPDFVEIDYLLAGLS